MDPTLILGLIELMKAIAATVDALAANESGEGTVADIQEKLAAMRTQVLRANDLWEQAGRNPLVGSFSSDEPEELEDDA